MKPLEPPRRTLQSDDQVADFIRKKLEGIADPRRLPAASPLHMAFRREGLACEQKRFRGIYQQVIEDWLVRSEEGVHV